MMPSSYSDTAIAVPTSAGVPPASPDLAYLPPRPVIARFTAIQFAMHKRRPDMLSIISNARTSSVMPTPDQLRSNRAAKSP
jgi:hypothetical protein